MIFKYFSKDLQRRWDWISVIITIVIVLFVFYYTNNLGSQQCEKTRKHYTRMAFRGVIIDKYRDFNHNLKTIEILKPDTFLYRNYIDHSGFYEFVQKGDSVTKKSGSLVIFVYRDTNKYKFTIDFKCEDL